jgi:hypothetical protein
MIKLITILVVSIITISCQQTKIESDIITFAPKDTLFIDSIGFQNNKYRENDTNWNTNDSLLNQYNQNKLNYLRLFKKDSTANERYVTSNYNLLKTIRFGIFDKLPFMDAVLATLFGDGYTTHNYNIANDFNDSLTLNLYFGVVFNKYGGFGDGVLKLMVYKNTIRKIDDNLSTPAVDIDSILKTMNKL